MKSEKECFMKNRCKQLHCEGEGGCLILYKLNYLFDNAVMPTNLRPYMALKVDIDGTDLNEFKRLSEIQNNIMNFVEDGKQLYIYSSQCGCGKTSWAARLMQTFFNKIWLKTPLKCRGLFIDVPGFLLALKDNISNKNSYITHIKENIANCDLVIWDDISNKVGTEFEITHLLSMINSRINNGKANIYTSNISPDRLSEFLDVRLASRIATASEKIELRGGDKRGLKNE